ncbi:NHL repeat-containing protein [bacterium]|nr:NHL repeat-containing protein [bacterium]
MEIVRNLFENMPMKKNMTYLKKKARRFFAVSLGWLIMIGWFSTVEAAEPAAICAVFEKQFGKPGAAAGELRHPQAIAVDLMGDVYICDTGNNRIQKFSGQGTFIKEAGGFGWGRNQFNQPLDVDVSTTLDVFVADYQNQRILRYDRQLNFISEIDVLDSWSAGFQFRQPRSIAISPQREFFILDDETPRILKFDTAMRPMSVMSPVTSGSQRMREPVKICLADDAWLFVSDCGSGTVLKFDYFGNFSATIGAEILEEPVGIDWSERGILGVADSGQDAVLFFDECSNLIGSLKSADLGVLFTPEDIAFNFPKIYVLDREQSVVLIFTLEFFESQE